MQENILQGICHVGRTSSVNPAYADCTGVPLVTQLVASSDQRRFAGVHRFANLEIQRGIRLYFQV